MCNREISLRRIDCFYAKLYDNQGPIARGSYPPPPSTGEGGKIRKTGEGNR